MTNSLALINRLDPNNDTIIQRVGCPCCEHTIRFRWQKPFQTPMSFREDDHGNMIYKFESLQHILCDECGEDIIVFYGDCYWSVYKKPILINKKLGIWCLADFLNIPNNYFSFAVCRAKNPYNPDLYYHYIMLTNEDYKNMPIFITEAEANEVLNGPQQGRDILAFIEGFFKKEQD